MNISNNYAGIFVYIVLLSYLYLSWSFSRYSTPFVLMVKVHFLNSYVPPCAYVRKHPLIRFVLNFQLLDFPSHLHSILFWSNLTIVIYNFLWEEQYIKSKVTEYSSGLCYPTRLLLQHCSPPNLSLIPFQGNHQANPCHCAFPCAYRGMFPLCSMRYILHESIFIP